MYPENKVKYSLLHFEIRFLPLEFCILKSAWLHSKTRNREAKVTYWAPQNWLMVRPTSRKLMILSKGLSGESRSTLDCLDMMIDTKELKKRKKAEKYQNIVEGQKRRERGVNQMAVGRGWALLHWPELP